jgi:hypothetical protein
MSTPKIPEPAQLVISVLTPKKESTTNVRDFLEHKFGPIELDVGPFAFFYTKYYDQEMGQGISRWIWSFVRPVERNQLAEIKCLTNHLEQSYTIHGKRTFNLDPGLLTLGNFVLGTGKNNAHRIYLDNGIFADLTLIFRRGNYVPLEWTYPDYRDEQLLQTLKNIREHYKWKIQNP